MKKAQVIFDGRCGFCNSIVRFIAKRDSHDKFVFISGDSKPGNDLINQYGIKHLAEKSIILIQHNRYHSKSVAVQKIMSQLPGWGTVAHLLYIVPKFIANAVYDSISKNRKRLCGNEQCTIPDKELRKKIVL